MSKKLRILLLEDVPEDAELVKRQLRKDNLTFTSTVVDTREGFLKELKGFRPDLIIADYSLPSFNAMEAIEIVQEQAPNIPIVVCTGSVSEEIAVECIKAGAADYVIKEHITRLGSAVKSALEKKRALEEKEWAEEALKEKHEYARNLIDCSLDMIISVDNKRRIIELNPAAEETLGYSRVEVLGKHVNLLYADPKEGLAAHKKTVTNGHHVQEILNRRKNGEIFPSFLSSSVLIDPGGERVGVMSVSRDITEQKSAEVAIKQRTEDLSLINELNNAANRGNSLQEIIQLFSTRTGEIFNCYGASIHFLSDDEQYLILQNLPLGRKKIDQIEKLLGLKISTLKILLKPGGLYQEILQREKPLLLLERESIHRQMMEYVNEVNVTSALIRKQIRKLIPQIIKTLGIQSTIILPLVSGGEAVGILDISRTEPFTESDLRRLQIISGQLTVAIERKRAEEALSESQEFSRNLIDSSLDMIIAVDNKRRITEFNHAAEEVFGYRREEVLGKHVNLLYADPKEGLAIHKKTVLNGQHVQEILNRRKNGETFPSLLASSVLLDPSGEIVGVMGVSRDITHYKQDEELLQFQADVLLNVQDSVIVTDLEGQIIYWNTGATELYGYTADEMIGQNPVVLYPDQDPELLAENLKSIVQGKNLTGAWKGRCKDGSEIWVAMKTTLARDAAGEPIGYIGVTRDITERKFAEEKLKLSNEIITHIENLVLVFNERGEVIFTGPSVTRVLGYSITEILGDGWCELTCRDDEARKRGKAYIAAAIHDAKKIESEPYERITYDKEGRPRWILWQDARGPGNTLIEIGHDITEYKNLESQLIQGEKLRAVGELAAGIAHEINSPIQFIGDNLRFLEEANQKTSGLLKHIKRPDEIRKGDERLSGVLDAQSHELSTKDIDYFSEEIPKAIEQSLDGISRISEIVQAMRAFSHPGGKEKTTIDINQAIESTITVSRNEWKYVAELQTDLDPNLPPVPCLAGEINQVFLNLIVNAAQAIQETQEAGVSQEKGTIAISTRQEKGNLEVHISDNGPGVPEEIKSRIFEPFFTTKGVGRGTGQGLAIAYMVVVEKHGGSVTLETEKGKGATFIIRLPFEPPLEKEPA